MNEIVALDAVSKNGLEIPAVFIRYPYRAQSFIQYPIRSAYSTRYSQGKVQEGGYNVPITRA